MSGLALEPDQILVIANSNIAKSVRVAEYYCAKRHVPRTNLLALPLGKKLTDTINRDDYDSNLAEPIRKKLSTIEFAWKIKCLLTTYGVPIKVGRRGQLTNQQDALKRLREYLEQLKSTKKKIEESRSICSPGQKEQLNSMITGLQSQIDRITGNETNASVDSELSMVLFKNYELYRWRPNRLQNAMPGLSHNTLMVSRLDGPGEGVAIGLVDKVLSAERTGLRGTAYVDSRGITNDQEPLSPGYFDQSLRDMAALLKKRTVMPIKEEQTEKLFAPGACPQTAIYCGWYSLKKYVDAFDFVDGAIAYHIASLEAVDLRNPKSKQWCPAMLKDGVAATLGAVAEPYLHSFPEPKAFFSELLNGRCLVEAYYHTKPFNSWQLILIGDPLYTPFKKSSAVGANPAIAPMK
jgi:uncharacterized protein (TIGR03790 family)